VTEDNLHDGYLIPKGSLVISNTWSVLTHDRQKNPTIANGDDTLSIYRKMSHDPDVYADPFTFKPERFLGNTPEPDPRDICFGFGRR